MSTQKIKDHCSEDARLVLIQQSITNINDTLVRFEKRFNQIDTNFNRLQSQGHYNYQWTLGLISGLYLFGSALITILIKFSP